MKHNSSYETIADYVKELPGEDLRRWNLEIFEKYPDIERETIEKLQKLKEKKETIIHELEKALNANEEGEDFITDLRQALKEEGIRVNLKYFKYAETRKEREIIIRHMMENAHKNYMQSRLKTIRKALNEITEREFMKWLHRNPGSKNLERSRIDRLIIVVYDENLVNIGNLREFTEEEKKVRNSESISEKIIEMMEEEREENIDEIVRKWKELKKKKDEEGKEINGIKIREIWKDKIKLRTMFYYGIPGKPIRLEVITNIQEAVKRELWEDEEIRKMYKLATWKKDTETNFILPEHLEIYRQKEAEIAKKVFREAQRLFIQELKNLRLKPTKVKAYVSIAEICYELPINTKKEELENLFFKNYNKFKPLAGTFIKIKYDVKTERPHLFLDLLYLNPEEPTATFKIYPKFIHQGQVYIRREIVARKSLKYLGKSEAGRALNEWLLLRPEKGRLLILKFLEFQMKKKEEFIKKQEAKKKIDIYNLPNILGISERALIGLIVNGRLPSHISTKEKRELMKRRIVEKKRHGLYEITPEFKKTLEKILA